MKHIQTFIIVFIGLGLSWEVTVAQNGSPVKTVLEAQHKTDEYLNGAPDSLGMYAQKQIELAYVAKDTAATLQGYIRATLADIKRQRWKGVGQWTKPGIQLAQANKDTGALASLLSYEALRQGRKGNTDSALTYAHNAIQLGRAHRDSFVLEVVLGQAAQLYVRAAQQQKAISLWRESFTINRLIQPELVGKQRFSLMSIGTSFRLLGQMDSASYYLRQALNLQGKSVFPQRCGLLYELAIIMKNQQLADSSLYYFNQALSCAQHKGDKQAEQLALNGIGSWYSARDSHQLAKSYFLEAMAPQFGIGFNTSIFYLQLGETYQSLGIRDSALYWHEQALSLSRKQRNRRYHIAALEALGKFNWSERASSQALFFLDSARWWIHQSAYKDALASVQLLRGQVLLDLGKFSEARLALEDGLAIASQNGDLKTLGAAYLGLAKVDSSQGRFTQAYQYIRQAMIIQDSANRRQYQNQVANWEVRYETAQKEADIERLDQAQQLQTARLTQTETQRDLLITILLILLVAITGFSILLVRLRKQRQKLAEANAFKNRLFSIIAHDLRGPITGFQSLGNVFEYYLDQDNKERIKTISKQVDQQATQLNRQLDNLLQWAIIHMGAYRPEYKHIFLRSLVEEVSLSYTPFLQEKNLSITFSIRSALRIKTDPLGLQIIFHNLMSNAIKFSEKGELSIRAKQDIAGVTVEIQDQGKGMDHPQLQAITQGLEITSTKGTLGESGTGIGWSLIREICGELGIRWDVKSTLGQGTTVFLYFPKDKL